MKRIIMSLVVAFMAAGSVFAQLPELPPVGYAPEGSPVDKWGRLKVDGASLKSSKTNEVVQLKGMSFDWTSNMNNEYGARQFYNERVVAWLAVDWRASVVRAVAGVSDKNDGQGPFDVGGTGYIKDKEGTKNLMHTIARAAIWQGIYVIIDWHSHRAHQTNSTYPQGERPEAILFFQEMARAYKDYPNVIYEIYNEPLCNTQDDGNCWSGIKGYSEPVIDAIRAIDPHGIIIVGTPGWARQINVAAQSPITGNNRGNLVYSLHFYADHVDGTNGWWQIPFTSWSNNPTIPIFVSESGLSKADGNNWEGGGPSGGDHWYNKMDANKVSWVNWRISSIGETSAALVLHSSSSERQRVARGKWLDSDLTQGGKHIRNKIRGSNPGANRTFKVNVTVQGNGSVSGNTNLEVCAQPALTATPAAGQRFEGWRLPGGVTSTANPHTSLEVCYDRDALAVFFPQNLISNSTFTTGSTGWAPTGSGIGFDAETGELVIAVASNATSDAGMRHASTQLQGGKKYKLTFSARASGSRTITPRVRPGGINASWIDMPDASLSAAFQDFEAEFSAPGTAAITNAILEFRIGAGGAGDVIIDNVMLVEDGNSSVIPQAVSAKPFKTAFNGRALVLSGGGRVADVTVYDLTGRVRMSKQVSLSTAGTQVSLNSLPAGVYTVRYKVDGKAFGSNERVMLAR